ncbi:MAG: DNA translocase FtsK 4TM domain-containing protein [Phycisphaerales bacterium]|nr:MAG: DNA translocase FtsK 4TM domain-containing protein [Phycisphaerales bacterium]
MAKKAVSARRGKKAAENGPSPAIIRRVAWVALAGVWLFMVIALGSFDSADWPSHTVAIHNEPVANLCGEVGAFVAYNAYYVIGVGAWVVLVGVGGYLAVTALRRPVTHPVLRFGGLVLMALGASSFHGLLFPQAGPLAGAHAGLLAEYFVSQLGPRFSNVGSFLLILAGFGVGAIVAVDRIVLALPRLLLATLGVTRKIRAPRIALPRFRRASAETSSGSAPRSSWWSWRRRKPGVVASIDPDAGGIGATDAFIPEEHEVGDEDEEYEEEEYEYEDEEEEEEEVPEKRALTAEELREKIAKLPLRMAAANRTVARDEDIPREESFEGYKFPTLDLLVDPESNFSEKMESFVRKQAEQLEEAMQTYGIDGEVVGIESGPAVTLYSVQLAPGTKVAKVSAVASDLARAVRAHRIRIVPNMAGKTTVGIEVPNQHKERVRLKELMSSGEAEGMTLPMFLGKDASGEALVADLTRMPHMLIAGTTGSGKSVCMNSIIMSWLYTKRPDELKLVMVDPKMVELSQFGEIPHLMCPVVTESSRAVAILEWAVHKMEERYELLREARVRDVKTYNTLGEEKLYERFEPGNEEEKARIPKKMPYIVFVVDELADMILTHKEVEQHIVRIAQKARAVGIHLIIATQRPQANVVTGLIKSNMPCRVSFKVASGMDSRIVLDQKGAELLLGQGDMLFLSPHTTEVRRAQGTLVTDTEIRKVVKFLKEVATPTFERSLISIRPAGAEDPEAGGSLEERDPLFDQAVEIMIETGRGSVSLLQRRLSIGYSRSSRLVDQMGLAGILGEHKGSVAREVLITREDWERMKAMVQEAETEGTLYDGRPSNGQAEEDEEVGDVPEIETVSRDDEDSSVPAEYEGEYRM